MPVHFVTQVVFGCYKEGGSYHICASEKFASSKLSVANHILKVGVPNFVHEARGQAELTRISLTLLIVGNTAGGARKGKNFKSPIV